MKVLYPVHIYTLNKGLCVWVSHNLSANKDGSLKFWQQVLEGYEKYHTNITHQLW